MSPSTRSGVVLVTGCSSGSGNATAERLAGAGWTVYATARRPETLADLLVTPSVRAILAPHALLPDRAWDAFLRTRFPGPGEGGVGYGAYAGAVRRYESAGMRPAWPAERREKQLGLQ
ncbi:MAG TPA: SDR family NAD(P)-dependent oxidoreductase [Solirubrobacteraceae bacterium]|nr:SDR family NAD(P)-dependent oxidoreductase [Solirubrobacteraceae bacterium]